MNNFDQGARIVSVPNGRLRTRSKPYIRTRAPLYEILYLVFGKDMGQGAHVFLRRIAGCAVM